MCPAELEACLLHPLAIGPPEHDVAALVLTSCSWANRATSPTAPDCSCPALGHPQEDRAHRYALLARHKATPATAAPMPLIIGTGSLWWRVSG